ncbi:uroporphyrinogen-III synthase [Campylobacter sputorum subsp. bubulus]|uniref:Uroporphyrinogen-III synthase n=1 Tax=Campylobacter sputorum subsp. sputorum TaxID=32024 RepID=A0A381DI71_9BACT|nr:uroporphyrinogen-III synthase [Campylobacter sputorum]ASM35215.1 uroporphyrinogen III synthase [Campylobacter sputorum aubsp. sputorum RM3237]KAB0580976.1 uroporphyrinogen-III synthase [Campylobacter sputorum subsp. sputorum]QEL05404.1 uroporphyrinogen III synthase [Campylobacter sputorum subsp. sputorum]SUX08784.1 uroporphyrinogen-III synthase [Campylobacter sputorum subsp. bubulus]SUX10092.1 uroporphyrinogen-III synthase [Campylobacter sputorum subsp. sputorum]
MIYLVSHTKFNDNSVKHLQVCEIKFHKFSVDLSKFDALVLTSKNSVKALKFNLINLANLEVFSIGEGTTKEALNFGFTKIYTAKNAHGNEFANEIARLLKSKKTLFLKAKEVVSDVFGILKNGGVNLIEIIAYENVFLNLPNELKPPKNSIIIFTSPSNVDGFLRNFELDLSYKIIAIGKKTAISLKNFPNIIVSKTQSIENCIEIAKNLA